MKALREPLLQDERPDASTSKRDSCLFLWVQPLLDRGRLALADLALEETDVSQADARLQARLRARPQDSLARCLMHVFAPQFARAAACKLLAECVRRSSNPIAGNPDCWQSLSPGPTPARLAIRTLYFAAACS
eukprot:1974620-Prymnesium_polylepis.1